jgi:serine/threonine protein kinase
MFHDDDCKKKIEILKSVLHVSVIIGTWSTHVWLVAKKYIVKFVNFSEKQKSLLMMKYLRLENLVCQDFITEEDALQILWQELQILSYLHSHSSSLTHRDIKSKNILVQSRIFFVIKLVDFELTKNDFILKTFCETNEYAALEIWERRHYIAIIDIWSLKVIVLQYEYGLPRPSQKRKGKLWCRDIVKAAENMKEKENALIDLISIKMLRMHYRQRQSVNDCLKKLYRLRFRAIESVEIERETPTKKTTDQDDITRIKFIITQSRQNDSSKFYNVRSASKTTKVASSKRDIREEVHDYNFASLQSLDRHTQKSAQIRNAQTEDKITSTRSKRQWSQITQSFMINAFEREQSKRSRALISCEADEQFSKTSNPEQRPERPERLERSISSNHDQSLTTDVASLIQDKACSYQDSDLEISLSTQVQTLESKSEQKYYTQYTYKEQNFRECRLNNRDIRMRVSDKWICFTHLALTVDQNQIWVRIKLDMIRRKDRKKQKKSWKAYHHSSHRQDTLIDLFVTSSYLKEFDIYRVKQLRHMIIDDIKESSFEKRIMR